MDYVDALGKLLPVVKTLQEDGCKILAVTASNCCNNICEVHVFEPKVNGILRSRNATVRRLNTRNEWSVNVDGVRVFWLRAIENEPEEWTVPL